MSRSCRQIEHELKVLQFLTDLGQTPVDVRLKITVLKYLFVVLGALNAFLSCILYIKLKIITLISSLTPCSHWQFFLRSWTYKK